MCGVSWGAVGAFGGGVLRLRALGRHASRLVGDASAYDVVGRRVKAQDDVGEAVRDSARKFLAKAERACTRCRRQWTTAAESQAQASLGDAPSRRSR